MGEYGSIGTMGRLLLVLTWIPTTLFSIFACMYLLAYFARVPESETLFRIKTKHAIAGNQFQFFAALPQVLGAISTSVQRGDARPEIIRTFLNEYNSPLAQYADFIVEIADKYSIDYQLIPAIAMQESGGCKFIPEESYNCWGYGIYGDKITKFRDYKEGIETVTKGLKNRYIDHGLVTPEEIMTRYTPRSNGSWKDGVNHFISEMQ